MDKDTVSVNVSKPQHKAFKAYCKRKGLIMQAQLDALIDGLVNSSRRAAAKTNGTK